MAYNSRLDARAWRGWPKRVDYPSTRDSVRIWNRYFPVKKTLTAAGTAEDILTVNPGQPTINMITNPSMETGDPPTGYTADGATLAQDATYYQYGTKSMEITPDNSADNEGCYWDLGSFPPTVPLSFSCYFRDAAAGGDEALVMIKDDAGNTIATGNTVTLSTSWQRSIVTMSPGVILQPTNLRLYIVTGSQHGTAFYADGAQAETLETPSAYCDGAQGHDFEWFGTAHASESRRYPRLTTIRGGDFHVTRDCYINFDRDASRTATNEEDRGVFYKGGTDANFDHPIHIAERISLINYWPGEQPEVYGSFWGVTDKEEN